jgi:hypothetical protein
MPLRDRPAGSNVEDLINSIGRFFLSSRRAHVALALAAGVLAFFAVQSRDAQVALGDAPAQAVEAPLVVKAGVYVLSIGQFNTATGTYVVDMYLTLQCDRPCTPNRFEFMNGRATSSDLLEDEPDYKSYRIQASLQTDPDLRDYPFDRHNLFIQFEDKSQSNTKVVYEADPSLNGVDPSVIIAGWQLVGWQPRVIDHLYPTFDTTYSRFQFDVIIARGTLSSVFKAILPALFIVLGGFLALLLGPDKALHRLGINTSAVIGGIMFHINLTSQLPPLGYLTLADKFMIVNYIGLIAALVATVVLLMMSATGDKQARRALTVHRFTATLIPSVWLVGQVLVFVGR